MTRKWLFVLPSIFTVSSIFCGVFSIVLSTRADGATANHDFFLAAMAILFGMFFDGFDGRVARLTRTQSEFGVQLDSLADVVTFGVAPAMLLYSWALEPLGWGGVFVAGLFVIAGALRLARFNVMATKSEEAGKYFLGLPIPVGAGVIMSLVIAATRAEDPQVVGAVPAAILSLVLSYLMVSNVHFHSFKRVRLSHPRALVVAGAIVAFGILVAVRVRPSFVLISYASVYVLVGLIEDIVFRRRREAELELAGHSLHTAVAVDDSDRDEV